MQSHELEFFLTKYKINTKNHAQQVESDTKFDRTVDERKGRLNPSRDKNEDKHRRKKVEKSCLTFLLCGPGWCVHKSDVHNKWDDNTHTHALYIYIIIPLQVLL